MHVVVVGQPSAQLLDDGLGIWPGADADGVALERADEGFGHAVGLRAADGRRARHQADVAGEGAGVAGGVAATVVGEPLDRPGQAVHGPVALLDGGHHQVLDVLGGDAASGRHMPHRLAIAAVDRERDAHLLAVVAHDLERVGAAGVALVDRDPTIVAPFLPLLTAALEEQPVHLHDAVDAF
jgi:hypothetical protein